MFIPNSNKCNNLADIHSFIHEFGFAALVSCSSHADNAALSDNGNSVISATHIPFVLDTNIGENGALIGHMAKANDQHKSIENEEVMVIFSGPHAYISPTWYTGKPSVPTWNYSVVHAYGKVSLLSSTELLESLDKLCAKYEPSLFEEAGFMDKDYINKLLIGIVGIKISVTRFEAQMKLGLQRSANDQDRIYAGLMNTKDPQAHALAAMMKKHR